MNLKIEESQNKKCEDEASCTTHDTPQDYEQMLQKLEAEVRNHIRVLTLSDGAATQIAYREHPNEIG